MSVKRRVIEILDIQGVVKDKFFKDIGVSSANFRGKPLDSALSSDVLAKILTVMPEVNMEYLLLGTGEKFKHHVPDSSPEVLNNLNKTQKLYQDLLEIKDQENKILRDMLSSYQSAPMRQNPENEK